MDLNQDNLNHISKFLNLEKMLIRHKIELYCFPKEHSNEFERKVEIIKKEIGNGAELKIIYEGEITNDNIELPTESGTDGIN